LDSIREIYCKIGVDNFYSSGMAYTNPHAKEIETLIKNNHSLLPLDNVLDLSCGTGLATNILQSIGYHNIIGADPYLHNEYTTITKQPCYNMSFKDIIINGLQHSFSCIICSFALHLCKTSMLHNLLWRLSTASNCLVVISPSKFPIIGKPKVERFCYTTNKKRVHFREYDLSRFNSGN
jgi:hypothetical protein